MIKAVNRVKIVGFIFWAYTILNILAIIFPLLKLGEPFAILLRMLIVLVIWGVVAPLIIGAFVWTISRDLFDSRERFWKVSYFVLCGAVTFLWNGFWLAAG